MKLHSWILIAALVLAYTAGSNEQFPIKVFLQDLLVLRFLQDHPVLHFLQAVRLPFHHYNYRC